jgi:hypothetical protein
VQLKDILKYSAPVERGLTGGQKYWFPPVSQLLTGALYSRLQR